MNLQGVSMHTACSRCGMELPERVSSPWCTRCKRCAGLCSVCRRPVRGLLHWCPVCGHGGHLSCHKLWFSQHLTCPSGCGHDCCSQMITIKWSEITSTTVILDCVKRTPFYDGLYKRNTNIDSFIQIRHQISSVVHNIAIFGNFLIVPFIWSVLHYTTAQYTMHEFKL